MNFLNGKKLFLIMLCFSGLLSAECSNRSSQSNSEDKETNQNNSHEQPRQDDSDHITKKFKDKTIVFIPFNGYDLENNSGTQDIVKHFKVNHCKDFAKIIMLSSKPMPKDDKGISIKEKSIEKDGEIKSQAQALWFNTKAKLDEILKNKKEEDFIFIPICYSKGAQVYFDVYENLKATYPKTPVKAVTINSCVQGGRGIDFLKEIVENVDEAKYTDLLTKQIKVTPKDLKKDPVKVKKILDKVKSQGIQDLNTQSCKRRLDKFVNLLEKNSSDSILCVAGIIKDFESGKMKVGGEECDLRIVSGSKDNCMLYWLCDFIQLEFVDVESVVELAEEVKKKKNSLDYVKELKESLKNSDGIFSVAEQQIDKKLQNIYSLILEGSYHHKLFAQDRDLLKDTHNDNFEFDTKLCEEIWKMLQKSK